MPILRNFVYRYVWTNLQYLNFDVKMFYVFNEMREILRAEFGTTEGNIVFTHS